MCSVVKSDWIYASNRMKGIEVMRTTQHTHYTHTNTRTKFDFPCMRTVKWVLNSPSASGCAGEHYQFDTSALHVYILICFQSGFFRFILWFITLYCPLACLAWNATLNWAEIFSAFFLPWNPDQFVSKSLFFSFELSTIRSNLRLRVKTMEFCANVRLDKKKCSLVQPWTYQYRLCARKSVWAIFISHLITRSKRSNTSMYLTVNLFVNLPTALYTEWQILLKTPWLRW